VAYSAGGLFPCGEMLGALPRCFGLSIFRCAARLAGERVTGSTHLVDRLLGQVGGRRREALATTIYVAPPGAHLVIARGRLLALSLTAKVNYFRPATDPLFESMAQVFGRGAISVVLSGLLADGARGTAAVKECGGLTMAQDKESSKFFDMPSAAIDLGKAELVLSPRRLALALSMVAARGA
jgi:two-component system chemotaxis response regulator CheB